MPEPPRRKRFQIHLSTAIVLMFVAGVLIWANMRDRYKEHDTLVPVFRPEDGSWHFSSNSYTPLTDDIWWGHEFHYFGWPFDAVSSALSEVPEVYFDPMFDPIMASKPNPYAVEKRILMFEDIPKVTWHKHALALNVCIGLSILTTACIFLEWLIRRRAVRKST